MEEKTLLEGIKFLEKVNLPNTPDFEDTATIDVWYELLKDISDIDFTVAVKSCAKTCKFFPTISEIREKVFKANKMLPDSAWVEVLEQIQKCAGRDSKPTFSSPTIERVVRSLGGIGTIWKAGIESESYYRTMFIKSYTAISDKEQENLMLGEPTQEEAKKILDGFGINPKGIE